MKLRLLILFLGLCLRAIAQTPEIVNMPDKPYRLIIDSLFANIDKSAVTSGTWYDRSVALAKLHDFNTYSPDTSSSQIYDQAYFQLYHATYANFQLLSPDNSRSVKEGIYRQGNIPIGIINFAYQYLDTGAISNNQIYESAGLYYDNPNRTTNPWRSKHLTMGAVLADSVLDEGAGVNFVLSEPFFLQNDTKQISTVQIDFGDGTGLRTVSFGSTVNVSYQQDGFKKITYVITFTDNSQVTTYSALTTRYLPTGNFRVFCANRIQFNYGFQSAQTFQGYDESSARKGRGDLTVFYHHSTTCETVLRKPIILIDGFDPGSRRIAYDYNPNNDNTLYRQMFFSNPVTGTRDNLVDSLNGMGYDVIMLDFPKYQIGSHQVTHKIFPNTTLTVTVPDYLDGGADYIERNAMVLVHLIDSVNNKLANNGSTEQLVVIGPSMGGLISRYALAYMEKNNKPHNTRLFLSFDAPHLGANIPLGDQLYINYFAEINAEAKKSRDEQLASVAAKQMLRFHYSIINQSIFGPISNSGAYGFRDRFQGDLDAMGWPTALRKVAVVNGSIAGAATGNGCQTAFEMQTRVNVFNTRVAKATVRFMPASGGDCKIFEGSHFPFSSSYFKMGGLSANIAGIDNAPGCLFNTQQIIKEQAEGSVRMEDWPHRTLTTTFSNVQLNHSFISTVSALAVNNGLANSLYQTLNDRNLVATSETPFDSYFAPQQNEPHIFLTSCNVGYILNEIKNIPQSPVGAQMAIAGVASFTDTATYKIANLPTGSAVTWTANPYNIASLSPSGNGVKLTRTFFGDVTLTASVVTPCGTKEVTRVVNAAQGPTAITGVNFICKDYPQIYTIQNLSSTATVSWSLPSSAGGVLALSPNTPQAGQLTISNQGWYSVQTLLTAVVSDNGSTTSYTLPVAADSFGAGGSYVQDAGWVGNANRPGSTGYASSSAVTTVYPYNEVRVQLSLSQFQNIAYVTGPAPRYWNYDRVSGKLIFSLPTGYSSGIPFTWQITKVSGGCPANLTFFSQYVDMNAFVAYPNPANSSITVAQADNTTETRQQGTSLERKIDQNEGLKPFNLKFMNEKGNILFQAESSQGKELNIRTDSYQNGTYFLHIIQDKKVIKKQIIIQH